MSGPAALVLVSGSLASDAAHLASRDIAAVADDLRVDYRLVGGNAVTLLTYVHHVDAAVPLRETADADLGAHLEVLGEPALLEAMTGLGYTQREGNRFVRHAASPGGPLELAVDVLAPSRTGRLETNQPVGALVVDAVPGLPLALRMPATWAHVTVTLTAAETLTYTVALPHVLAMLAMKAHAFAGRMATRDAVDIWRLLEAAHAAGYGPVDWPRGASTSDTHTLLRRHFTLPSSAGMNALRSTSADQARVRLLTQSLLPPVS